MSENIHVRSFREFVSVRLPEALGAVVPLSEYAAEWTGEAEGRVTFCAGAARTRVTFENLPFPRADGTFAHGSGRVVVLSASSSDLGQAEVKAVGEQLMDIVQPRLTTPPEEVVEDAAALRAWFPLDRWLREFLFESNETAQWLDDTNEIAAQTHLRRVRVMGPEVSFHPSQIGRACPFETPEGPNCGRVLTLAFGATVEDGRIIPAGDAEASLGLSARLVPLLCHNHPNRQLMGANMIRQMVPPDEPEAPLVRSGLEPEDGSAWLGRNLLTAFVHWKGMNYEDAIVVSEPAAAKLASGSWPLEVGDKLSNRHGAKGVVGAVLPEEEMPHVPDGRPVELAFDPLGLYSRLNFGQVIEAALGLIAETRGEPIMAAPFRRTTPDELHAMLREAGLPESGQFVLRDGREGAMLDGPTTVGLVYWGKLVHLARAKIHAVGARAREGYLGQRIGRMEYSALRTARAYETIIDAYSTRGMVEEAESDLEARVANGFLAEREPAPSPAFRRVQRALRGAGIAMEFDGMQVRFRWSAGAAAEEEIRLAEPVSHPWRREVKLTHLSCPSCSRQSWERLAADNERLARVISGGGPRSVEAAAREALQRDVTEVFGALSKQCEVVLSTQASFTGRAVLAPGYALRLGELGLPEDIAWPLFAPLAGEQIGTEHVAERSARVRRAVARVMENSVVVLNRAPTWEPTCVTAFRPVLAPGRALLLHPLCCRLFNADYDGDQAAVWLPLSRAAQDEAREKLTIEGHLRRDPSVVVSHLAPSHAALAGLAYALETDEGRAAWPEGCRMPQGPLTRQGLIAELLGIYEAGGPAAVLEVLEQLYALGVASATRSGASLSPFVGEGLRLPQPPASDAGPSWYAYASIVEASIMEQGAALPSLHDPIRAILCGARGSAGHLRATVGPVATPEPYETHRPIPHGFRDGLEAEEAWSLAASSRRSLQEIWGKQVDLAGHHRPNGGASVLRQAMDADDVGAVFAEAAETEAVDPLTDEDIRLWMGLMPNSDSS